MRWLLHWERRLPRWANDLNLGAGSVDGEVWYCVFQGGDVELADGIAAVGRLSEKEHLRNWIGFQREAVSQFLAKRKPF